MAADFVPVNYVSTGTLQKSRMSNSLLPDNLNIDDHVSADFMAFVVELSKYARYYNSANQEDGNWEAFFKNEYPFSLALIASVPLKEEMAKLQTMGSWLESGKHISKKDLNITAQIVFEAIIVMARRIDGWYLLFNPEEADLVLLNEITSAIENSLRSSLKELRKLGELIFGQAYEMETGATFKVFSPVWEEKEITPSHKQASADTSHEPGEVTAVKQHHHYEKLAQLLWNFTRAQSYIVARAKKELESYLNSGKAFKPHTALLMAYWEMYTLTQGLVNNYAKKHLDFYYYKVLNLKKITAQPDQSFVCFQLAKGITESLVQKGTSLDAGKDSDGNPVIFTTDTEVVVNNAQVTQLMNLFFAKKLSYSNNKDKFLISDIFSDSTDPVTLATGANGFEPFGSDQGNNPSTPLRKTVGFAIASPIFLLNEGTRVITIDLVADDASFNQFKTLITDMYGSTADLTGSINKQLSNAFVTYGSGAKNWIAFKNISCSYTSPGNTISISITAGSEIEAVLNYQNTLPGDDLQTTLPVIKVMLNNDNPLFAYQILSLINISSVKITVNVSGISTLTLYNSGGKLDPSKPFQPFGQIPVVGSYLSVGNPELSQKNIDEIDFNMEWFALPANGFGDYYGNYVISSIDANGNQVDKNIVVSNNDFTVQISKPGYGLFQSPGSGNDFALFESKDVGGTGALLKYSQLKCVTANVSFDDDDTTILKYNFDQSFRAGFFNIELSGPPSGFYNELYIHSMSSVMLDNAKKLVGQSAPPPSFWQLLLNPKKAKATTDAAQKTSFNPIPNAPFVPVIKSLNIDYTASQVINLTQTGTQPDQGSFYYVDVFSAYPVFPSTIDRSNDFNPLKSIPLLPVYNNQCYFFAAFEQVKSPQVVDVFVQVITKPAIKIVPDNPPFIWEYLSKTGWAPFTPQQIPGDNTSQFSKTGIMKFSFIDAMVTNNPIMPSGKIWIRASIETPSGLICNIRGIQTQGVAVTRYLDASTQNTAIEHVGPGTIKGFINANPQIKTVLQPAASTGGRNAEEDLPFYLRVSERLNHKQRAVTSYDYEHILLQLYPNLYYVRCLNHTTIDNAGKSPGNVLMVVIPERPTSQFSSSPRYPYEELQKMQSFIAAHASPFANITVINPQYIFLTIHCTVALMIDDDPGYYLKCLNQAICTYLAPWTGEAETYSITGKLTAYNIISVIENQPYISEIDVDSFSISFSTEVDNGEFKNIADSVITKDNLNDNIIDSSKPWTVVASRVKHDIKTTDGSAG